jgi:signal transduction histidine kinase/ligand-binding sensor domain-containing protein/DNA-binding response OmpR family regulator
MNIKHQLNLFHLSIKLSHRLILAVLLCFLSLTTVEAQTGRYFTTANGLSGSVVKQIYQDHRGLIWIATNSGINVYNGYQMLTQQRDGEQKHTLSSNLVNCLFEDSKETMYVGTNTSLQVCHDRQFQTVKIQDGQSAPSSFYISCVFQRRNGDLLVGTSGRGVWKLTGKLEARPCTGPLSKINTVVAMSETSDGTLYLVSNNQGVWELKGNRLRLHATPPASSCPQTICRDSRDNIFVGGLNGGLWVKWRGASQFTLMAATATMHITALALSPTGQLLLGTDGNGVKELNPITGAITTPPYFSNDVNLNATKVSTILCDRSGNIWLGLMQKGIFLYPNVHSGFSYMGYRIGPNNVIGDKCVMALANAKDGGLWISTDNGGLFCIDKNDRLSHRFLCDDTPTLPHAILGMTEDSEHRLWVGSYQEGCGWIDQETGAYHRLPFTYGSANAVFDVKVDRNQNLWVGTMGDGLKQYNLKTNKLTEYRSNPSEKNSIYSNFINQLYLSPDNRRLYVCTTGGLCCLDLQSYDWNRTFGSAILLKDYSVFDVLEAGGMVWMATPDGLYSYSLSSRKITRYSTAQGLSSNIVMSVLSDQKGNIWMSTNNGLSCLNPKTGKVSNYYEGDGLQGNEFSEGVALYSPANGLFCFGGMNGITWFNPTQIAQSRRRPSILLTDFIIGDQPVIAGMKLSGYTVTEKPAYESDEFSLGHQDNTFTIEVSSLTYDNPERITYLYKVNDDKWQQMPRGKNTVTFAHMVPGTYEIKVKAIDNQLESEVRTFKVRIHPAWYFSWWAELIYLLIFLYLIYRYLRSQKRKQQDKLRLQKHIHAEQMSEAKLKFFINLSHDIRTPMTLILTPLLTLIKEDKNPERQNIYALMRRNADRILHLINQIMDLRKIEKGQMQMHFAETDLVDFTRGVVRLFQIQAKNRQINLRLDADEEPLMVWIDRSNFDKVLMNLLSNAFKFTHTGGNIVISISHDSTSAHLTVADDGDTIPEDKIDRIFDRFYQGSTIIQGRQSGTGVGLDLVRSIIDLHHGTVSARNTENPRGCAFDVTIPLGNSHLKPQDLVTAEEQAKLDSQLDMSELEPQMEEKPQQTDTKPIASDSKPTIVVVDDEDDIRQYIAQQLASNYHIIECTNGKEAQTTILREQPALVISDVMMPEMDGFTLCANLKSNINTNHIPVILLTAKGRDEDKTEGMELGADAYISKPFSMDLLRSTIGNLLRERALLRNKFSGKESMDDDVKEVKLQNPDDKLLERVVHIINENMSNEDFNVDALSNEAGISRVHLYRKMKELTNQTPSEFIRNVRLKQAANLLSDPHQSISEVMYACGFSNRASFSSMFKRFYGVSPREYQQEKGSDK